jgi:hypothetical protein
MIAELSTLGSTSMNGQTRCAADSDKTPERTPYELLAWAILEQAVDDLANLCRWGVITKQGDCRPWPSTVKFKGGYHVRVLVTIAAMRGPNDHRTLKSWLLSKESKAFCDLIGCRLDPSEIFWKTAQTHGGLP